MRDLKIDIDYLRRVLEQLLDIPSPTGMTDQAVGYVCAELTALDVPFELTRRGAIRADLKGKRSSPDRAIVSHVDTLGAIIKGCAGHGCSSGSGVTTTRNLPLFRTRTGTLPKAPK